MSLQSQLQSLGFNGLLTIFQASDISLDHGLVFSTLFRATIKGQPVTVKVLAGDIKDLANDIEAG